MKNLVHVGFWIIVTLWLKDAEVKKRHKQLFYIAWTPQPEQEDQPKQEKQISNKEQKSNYKKKEKWRNGNKTNLQNSQSKSNVRKRRH